jgi:hypothetical protein
VNEVWLTTLLGVGWLLCGFWIVLRPYDLQEKLLSVYERKSYPEFFTARLRKPQYIIEARIVGVAFIIMGSIFLFSLLHHPRSSVKGSKGLLTSQPRNRRK